MLNIAETKQKEEESRFNNTDANWQPVASSPAFADVTGSSLAHADMNEVNL